MMKIRGLIASLVVLVAVSTSAAYAAPDKTAPSPKAKAAPVSGDEKKAVSGVITDLYNAYVARDVDKVIDLERLSIEESAETYEKQGKGKADDVRQAFRGATEEVLKHKDFAMKPLNLKDAVFQHDGNEVVVSSVIPIIATESVEVGEPGGGQKVRLRIGKFVFKKTDKGYQIVRMQMF